MVSVRGNPAFAFGELEFDWDDVVLAAIGWGEWQQLERSLAWRLALVADGAADQVDPKAVRAAAVAFRRARGLLAGAEFVRWLEQRSLSTADLQAHLIRTLLPAPAQAASDSDPLDLNELADTIDAEAILSGRLQRCADRLVRCAAAAHGLASLGEQASGTPFELVLIEQVTTCRVPNLDQVWTREHAPRIARLFAAERRFAELILTSERLERRLAEHHSDWQRVHWEEVAFGDEGAAREAALLVRDNGLTLTEVAKLARATSAVHEAYAGEAGELAGMLSASTPNELLGPLANGQSWRLIQVRERTPPSLEDPRLRDRVGAELVEDALARYLSGRVVWHGKH